MQILPRYDLGGNIGKNFGEGVGDSLSTMTDRKRLLEGLESLKDLNLDDMSYGDITKTLAKGFVGIPGGMQLLQEILPGFIKQKQSLDYVKSAYNEPETQGGSVDVDETDQLIKKSVPGGQEKIFTEKASITPTAGTARPELAPTAQKVPGLEEDVPAYRPMSNKERMRMGQAMAKGGSSIPEIQKALNIEDQRRRDEWKSRTEAKKARTEQFVEERGLEDIQEDRIKNYVSEEIGVPVSEIDPYEMQKGYEYFKEAQKNNPNLKDRELWNKAKNNFKAMRENFSKGEMLFERPSFMSSQKNRKIADARQWAQDHLKSYGNFRQDREKMMSLFTQKGYTKAEAASIVKPLSQGLEKSVKDMGRTAKKFGYQGIADKPLEGKVREKYINTLAQEIAENLKPTDSILLLRERLVRDNSIDEEMFSEALNQANQMLEEQGKTLNPEQKSEIPDLQDRVIPTPLDIFFGDDKFDIRKYLPRFQK